MEYLDAGSASGLKRRMQTVTSNALQHLASDRFYELANYELEP